MGDEFAAGVEVEGSEDEGAGCVEGFEGVDAEGGV